VNNASIGEGLSKSGLLLEFCERRRQFLGRIRRRIYDLEIAEDIFQEACIKFMTSQAVFRYPQAGTNYFCRILENLIIEHIKRSGRLEYREHLPELVCEPEFEWDREMIMRSVHEAVGQLPADDQRLLAVYLDPGSGRLRDKCKILGLPNSTMRFQFHRIIGKLHGMVTDRQ
jgi:RNA polymerase sigma factor (sigma-70 family)